MHVLVTGASSGLGIATAEQIARGAQLARELSVPLAWFPRLLHATPEQRQAWELIGRGEGLHWEELDEDISVAGLLAGRGDQTRRPPRAA